MPRIEKGTISATFSAIHTLWRDDPEGARKRQGMVRMHDAAAEIAGEP
jgi:hypothetical protein